MAQRAATVASHRAGLPSPVRAPAHDCDRESGCICKGVKLVHAVSVGSFAAQPAGQLPLLLGSDFAVASHGPLDESPLNEEDSRPQPLSGRQLRALYASLLI